MSFAIRMRTRCAACLFGVACAMFETGQFPTVAWGADFIVNSAADSGAGSLREAIDLANSAGAGLHSITFDTALAGQPISLSSSLPLLNNAASSLIINGAGAAGVSIDGNNAHQVFFVQSGNVAISSLTIANGQATGGNGGNGAGGGGGGLGAGGALFVNNGANVTLDNVDFDDNSASGGNGGSGNTANGGGGGGGFKANGGNGSNGGGGGGGFLGNGGAGSNGGGAGGGITGNGGNGSNGGGGGGGLVAGGDASNAGGTGSSGASGGAVGSPSFDSSPAGDGGDGQSPVAGGGGGGGLGGGNFDTGPGGNGGNGGDGGVGGGGGGGGLSGSSFEFGQEPGGGQGGDGGQFGGGGGGGLGFNDGSQGGNGGDFGGGGGAGLKAGPGISSSGQGGFGGGGGGAGNSSDVVGATAGFGGGAGGNASNGGEGGDGHGGAIFVREGGTLTIINSEIANNAVSAGTGGAATTSGMSGTHAGVGMYLHTGVTANVQVTDGQTLTYADEISGAGGLTKTGAGTLALSGTHNYTGNTAVNAGRFDVNGLLLDSSVTVGSGAVVGGNGAIDANLVNQGTVAPGNSIGTLAVNGTYTQASTATLEIEITDTSTLPGTTHDWLDASNGGTVNLDGAVSVLAAPGNYIAGTQYTFIDAQTINGTFDSITDDLAFFTAELGYTSTSAFFTLIADDTDFGGIAITPNQVAVGNYLDSISNGAIGDLADLITTLFPQTLPEVQAALEQMSGEIYGTTQQMGIQNTTLILHSIAQQLQPHSFQNGSHQDAWAMDDMTSALNESEIVQVSYQPNGTPQFRQGAFRRHNTWGMGFGLGGNADSDGNAGRLDYGMGGVLVGFDFFVDRGHRLGMYGGYVATGIDTVSPVASNDISSGQVGGYYTGRNGKHYYTLIGGFQFDDFESQRTIDAAGLNAVAEGDYDGWQGFGYLERGVNLHVSESCAVQPFAALQYIHLRQNGFTETGAGILNLAVNGIEDDSLRSMLGLRSQIRTVGKRRHITPEFRTVWVHEFLDTNSPVVARFAPIGGSSFIAEGLDMGRDWALVGTGLNCNLGRGWSAQANYDAQVNENQAFHVGSGSVQKSW